VRPFLGHTFDFVSYITLRRYRPDASTLISTELGNQDNGGRALTSGCIYSPHEPPPRYPVNHSGDDQWASCLRPHTFTCVRTESSRLSTREGCSHPVGSSIENEAASVYQLSVAFPRLPDSTPTNQQLLPRDIKFHPAPFKKKDINSSKEDLNKTEPPPAYSEGPSPLRSFTFVMAAAGGVSSIITQVQQGGAPVNALGDVGADETITMDLRGTRFVLSRDELLTLPEFVLLSLFPNGLFPEGHMGSVTDQDAVQVDYDPASLQYMLDFFRDVAQSIPSEPSSGPSQETDLTADHASKDEASKRAGIIVLREDLDFYAIPPRPDIDQVQMMEVKRAAARALLKQNGIFSGLKKSDEPGTTEAHLIEMLTAG
jgi:G patch domain-containing protein 1